MARPKDGITFWDRVSSNTITIGDCWLFTGHRDECGYGRIHKDGKLIRVHRAIWEFHNGSIPDKMKVCHKCDNPSCIKIEHLFLGTQADNVHDMWKKGRAKVLTGERNRSYKFTHDDVIKIRCRIGDGETCKKIADEYGVVVETIYRIKLRYTYKDV